MFKGFLVACLVLLNGLFVNFAYAENSLNLKLDEWVGAWQMTSGEYEENWELQWNEEKTHLNLTFASFEDEQPAFKATGFILFDSNTGRLHMYMMMNNGALHENIGKLESDGKYMLRSKTYGGPGFPDHDMIVSFEKGKMIFEYVYESQDGEPEVSKNVFGRRNADR